MKRPSRRTLMVSIAALGLFFACSSAHLNEAGVKSAAADHLDCEDQLIKLENLGGSDDGIVGYRAMGCGRQMRLDCWQDKEGVVGCRSVNLHGGGAEGAGDGTGEAIGAAAAGCACASLFGRSSKNDDNSSSGSSPMSTTPQRTKR